MSNQNTAIAENTKQFTIIPKTYRGQRVVTFADIDEAHGKPKGTASRNFKHNKKHFVDGVDYVIVTKANFQKDEIRPLDFSMPNRGITFLTESGYLMIVKSFTDDLSWEVQRQLVNGYFRAKSAEQSNESRQQQLPCANYIDDWYLRNKDRIKEICDHMGWKREHLYHKILKECWGRYDYKSAVKKYADAVGEQPKDVMDVLAYFYDTQKFADSYLDFVEENYLY